VDDKLVYGYTKDVASGEIVAGTWTKKPMLCFRKPDYKDLCIDLSAISRGVRIETESTMKVYMEFKDSARPGSAYLGPSHPIPVVIGNAELGQAGRDEPRGKNRSERGNGTRDPERRGIPSQGPNR
jgi:hypothetical protein